VDAVEEFLAAARRQPAGLLIEGEAGIGKSTLWSSVTDQAARSGFLVMTARTGQAESGLAHAAVADLFSAVDPALLATLPAMQRLAADRVLLRDDTVGRPTDERVTAAALLTAVHAMSAQTPVLIAVDDVQWLDPSSQAVLAFVARRLKGPVGVLVTERSGPAETESTASWLQVGPTGAVTRMPVPSMSLGALHTMVATRLGRTFSRPAIVRIAEMSGGNPLYALELARVADTGPLRSAKRLPATLSELVRLRVDGLDDAVRDALLVAASASAPTVDLLAQAVGSTVEQVTEVLEVAEIDGIVVIEGNRVRFTHPLLASGIYDSAEPPRRREIHRTLAGLKTRPELRARHLALAATAADDATLQALDAAADAARARGAPAAAAELVELAIQLGGDKLTRRIRAAEHHFRAGDTGKSTALLQPVLDGMPPGLLRALALNLLAAVRIYEDDYVEATKLLERARADAADNDAVMVSTLLSLALTEGIVGTFAEQINTVRQAVSIAERAGVPSLTSQALAMWVHVSFEQGMGFDETSMQRALMLEDPDGNTPIPFRASATHGLLLAFTGNLTEAEEVLARLADRCRERGAENDLMAVTGYQTFVAIWRGRYAEADRFAAETLERAEQLGGSMVIAFSISAVAAAYRGREDEVRRLAQAAFDREGRSAPPLTAWARGMLAFIEVSLGRYRQAADVVAPLVSLYQPFVSSEIWGQFFVPDAVEAFVGLRRYGDAEPLIEALQRNGAALDRPWMLAVGGRCRAMLLAARGDLDAALEAVQRAIAEHDRLPMPFERARTQLLMGEIQRRLRRKEAAAVTLREALGTFEELGTPLWAARARTELERAATQPRGDTAKLTASEQRIAELAASGMTNRDVAAALFISVKTVEINLTRAYRKLGIRSRAQLGQRLGRPGEGSDGVDRRGESL
jgi:DNA-binding NarL/FixJ family response regulator